MDDWRYILNSKDCYINLDGDVIQNDREVVPFTGSGGHRVVELLLSTNEYDHATRQWKRGAQVVYVWELMIQAWFSKWPDGAEPYFLDGDPWNCSAGNLRASIFDPSTGTERVIHVREERWGFSFDRRLRGKVEILETNSVFRGPAEAAKAVGGTRSGVSLVLSGRLETHCGFHFRWV
jgi:hypothetical protein